MDAGYNPEASCHNLLNGILMCCKNWELKPNREVGSGRADTILTDEEKGIGIIIEVKYAYSVNKLDDKTQTALMQVEERH